MENIGVRTAIGVAILLAAELVGAVGCIGAVTPSPFPNPVPVACDETPPALLEKLRASYPELETFEIQYSAKAGLYGVAIPSDSIELYDAAGNCVGVII